MVLSVNLSFTAHGRRVQEECRDAVKDIIREKLSCLTPAELAGLSVALEKLKNVGAKLE